MPPQPATALPVEARHYHGCPFPWSGRGRAGGTAGTPRPGRAPRGPGRSGAGEAVGTAPPPGRRGRSRRRRCDTPGRNTAPTPGSAGAAPEDAAGTSGSGAAPARWHPVRAGRRGRGGHGRRWVPRGASPGRCPAAGRECAPAAGRNGARGAPGRRAERRAGEAATATAVSRNGRCVSALHGAAPGTGDAILLRHFHGGEQKMTECGQKRRLGPGRKWRPAVLSPRKTVSGINLPSSHGFP